MVLAEEQFSFYFCFGQTKLLNAKTLNYIKIIGAGSFYQIKHQEPPGSIKTMTAYWRVSKTSQKYSVLQMATNSCEHNQIACLTPHFLYGSNYVNSNDRFQNRESYNVMDTINPFILWVLSDASLFCSLNVIGKLNST